MEGFFSRKETESLSRPDGKSLSCISCGLYKHCKSPKIKPFGNFKKGILNIGEAPGAVEDRAGKPWQGKEGRLLQKTYNQLGIDLFEDCLNINAIQCSPADTDGNYRQPVNYEIDCCRKIVFRVIEEYKPKLIILFGQAAVYSLLGHRWKKDFGNITKWRGWTIPDQDFGIWLCPVFDPAYIESDDKNSVGKVIWSQDLKNALSKLQEPFPKLKEPTIEIIEDLSVLDTITDPIAFDYETTGIKPHAIGQKIVCAAVATSPDHVYVFMIPESRKERLPFINLLDNPDIPKIAQNIKFEETWSKVKLRQPVRNWVWDTMQATHIIDNRPGITGLKFQTYVQFGVVDYSSDLDPYIKATNDDQGANSINKIMDLLDLPTGKERLLKYCAYDAIYEYRLAMYQMRVMKIDLFNDDDLPF